MLRMFFISESAGLFQEGDYHPTARSRDDVSAPLRWLDDQGLLRGKILDFGAGRGVDAEAIGATAYDPNSPAPMNEFPEGEFDTIVSIYVLNVVPPEEQKKIVSQIKSLLADGGTAYLAVRRDLEKGVKGPPQWWVELSDAECVHEDSRFCVYSVNNGD